MNPDSFVELKKQKSTKKHSDATIRIQATAELQNLVLAWMKDSTGPRRNRSVFARKAEVANSTIQRLMNDDVFPSTDNLIKMLHVLFASDDLSAIKTKLEQHHTNLYTYIKNIPVFAKIPKKSSYSASTPESAEDKQLKIDVVRELREMISEFMRNNLDYSTIPTFARKAQVTDSTIRRIMSPGGGSIPTQDNLMRILVALTGFQNTREVVEYFEKRKSPIYIHLRRHTAYISFTYGQESGFVMEGVTAPTVPDDDDVYVVYSYIDPQNGTKILDLIHLLGAAAHGAMDKLIKKGLAVLGRDGILKLSSQTQILTKSSALKFARALIGRFTRAYADESRVTFYTERVSAEGYKELHRLTDEYMKAIDLVLDNKKGNIPFFLFGVLDKMEFKQSSEANEEVSSE